MAAPHCNFEQKQPITTTLRNICQSYPQDTVLRELLQNADDAGATEIEYVLDTNTYPGPYLHSELQDYHGPALLSRNNAVFADKDFASISSVGDSVKRTDPLTTGKFGQGFNSVYHMTDGPWILSRSLLLFLDPHHRWSKDIGNAGGPAWDFVEDHASEEITSHVRAFAAFRVKCGQELQETIIRIPLRTAGQATTSKIKNQPVSIKDIEQLLEGFCQDMESGGMLFLKHIRKITVRINDEVLARTSILQDDSENTQFRRGLPADFRSVFTAEVGKAVEVSRTFESRIQHENSKGSYSHRYLIHHLMAPSIGDAKLDTYGHSQKLFPWVAVAAPLNHHDANDIGKLFSTLSLPITTRQPVHVHGLFAIAPDRARLGFETEAVQWNSLMFNVFVSRAWISLLEFRNTASFQGEKFSLWPSVELGAGEMWTRLDESILRRVIEDDNRVWNTRIGCLEFSRVYFAPLVPKHEQYMDALASVELPAVYLEEIFLAKVKRIAKELDLTLKIVTPQAIRAFLRSEAAKPITHKTACSIANFCLQDAMGSGTSDAVIEAEFKDLHGIQCFETRSGRLSDALKLFLPRDGSEMVLFSGSRDSVTVDLQKLSPETESFLQRCIGHTTLERRTLRDLPIDWPTLYPSTQAAPADSPGHYLYRPLEKDALLRGIWFWLRKRYHEEGQNIPLTLYSLWLVPLKKDGQIRKLAPEKALPLVLVLQHDNLDQLLIDIANRSPPSTAMILDDAILGTDEVQFIGNVFSKESNCQLTTPNEIDFVRWLVAVRQTLCTITKVDRAALLAHLDSLVHEHRFLKDVLDALRPEISQLPLFSLRKCAAPYTAKDSDIAPSSLDRGIRLFLLPQDLPFLPDENAGVAFVDPMTPHEESIIKRLGLAVGVSDEQLLRDHLLPWVLSASEEAFASVKMALLHWLFERSKSPDESWANYLHDLPIIPLSTRDTPGRTQYGRLVDLVAPDSPHAILYFDDEAVFPDPQFYTRHRQAFKACGIGLGFNSGTIQDRANVYSRYCGPMAVLDEKVKYLTSLPLGKSVLLSSELLHEIQNLRWLPGHSTEGASILLPPIACRGPSDFALMDHVWGKVDLWVRADFEKLFGWDHKVPLHILLLQLEKCALQQEKHKVDAVLEYLPSEGYSELDSRPCILGSHGQYLPPNQTFYPGKTLSAHPIHPYIDDVDPKFGRDHNELLQKLNVKHEPTIDDLLGIQQRLISQDSLEAKDLEVAISTLEVATKIQREPELLACLSVPDTQSILRNLRDIVIGDDINHRLSEDIAGWNFTHAAISRDLSNRLGIENVSARKIRLNIDMEDNDKDDDEYAPKETYISSIRDTLERYSISDTFNEFLSNADDAMATKQSWCLDDCSAGCHAAQHLLTPELTTYQGPALFVHNDGVFSPQDFEGFKTIGQGGQGANAQSAGQFGRGSMSMYHFTDLPMLISNDSIVILDPQQAHLPWDTKNRRRKVGLKVSLTLMQSIAPDHLAPFDGLFGFKKTSDHFEGTLFRLPLRSSSLKSSFISRVQSVDAVTVKNLMRNYFDAAKHSLLFLSSIRSIEFIIRGKQEPEWSVDVQRSLENEVFKNLIVSSRCPDYHSKDEWRLGLIDLEACPADVTKPGKGHSKASEVGVAACLHHDSSQTHDKIIKSQANLADPKQESKERAQFFQKTLNHSPQPSSQINSLATQAAEDFPQTSIVFCKLPMPEVLDLPISIQGSFSVTGDRKTVAIEGTNDAAKWNRWLLTMIAELYVKFLCDLTSRIGEKAFQFWPPRPSNQSAVTISEILAAAFWGRVVKDHRLDHLYPLVEPQSLPGLMETSSPSHKLVKSRKNRKLHPAINIEAVHFDILPQNASAHLESLLLSFGLNLCRPPNDVWDSISATAATVELKLEMIDSDLLCRIFKQEENCAKLEAFLGQLKTKEDRGYVLALLYGVAMPKDTIEQNHNLQNLDGCRIIPKLDLDMALGTFSFMESVDEKSTFLSATPEEQKLFIFASDRIINRKLFNFVSHPAAGAVNVADTWRNAVKRLTESPCNICNLAMKDVGKLLAHSNSPCSSLMRSNDPMRDGWTVQLWKYINRKFDGTDSKTTSEETGRGVLQEINGSDFAIYRYNVDGKWIYISPHDFLLGPYMVEPADPKHQAICEEITGLICVDSSCLPTSLHSLEKDMSHEASFARFLRALSRLQPTVCDAVQSLKELKLTCNVGRTLRSLMNGFLSNCIISTNDVDQMILRALPIWTRARRTDTTLSHHLSADNTHFCPHPLMFMEWVEDLDHYVDPMEVVLSQESLPKMGIALVSADDFWPHIKRCLPQTFEAGIRNDYLTLLSYLRNQNSFFAAVDPLNGNSQLCAANLLYDRDEEIFESAFCEQQSERFVHIDLWEVEKDYWRSNGLRCRQWGELTHQDYLECCRAASTQSGSLRANSLRKVTAYLDYNKPVFNTWPEHVWYQISKISMFSGKGNVPNLQYRKPSSSLSSDGAELFSLDKAGQLKDIRIIWSQMKILKEPPAEGVFKLIPRGGRPLPATVYNHLRFLISVCQGVSPGYELTEYLKDVVACYRYLQFNVAQTSKLPNIRSAKLWFNTDTTMIDHIRKESLLPNLLSASEICLDAPDDYANIKVARKFLIPFETLLKALGCESIVQPEVEVSDDSNGGEKNPMDRWISEIRQLRDKNQLIDVIFEAEEQKKPAHRIFLAVASDYCRAQFSGAWGHHLDCGSTIEVKDMSFKTLSTLIDHAYSGHFEPPQISDSINKDEIADTLDDLLAIMIASDRWLMLTLHKQVDEYITRMGSLFVRPDNVGAVMMIAGAANSKKLLKHCQIFRASNLKAVKAFEKEMA